MDPSLTPLAQAAISAAAGLLGVIVGGWITARSQAVERRHKRIVDQVNGFYGPMIGFSERIAAKTSTTKELSDAASGVWQRNREDFKPFSRLLDENNRQFEQETLPLYRRMLEHFSANMALAEPSTRQNFAALVQFVEIWDRWLNGSIPQEVVSELNHGEGISLLHADLQRQHERLTSELRR